MTPSKPSSEEQLDEILSSVWKAGQSEDWDLEKVVKARAALLAWRDKAVVKELEDFVVASETGGFRSLADIRASMKARLDQLNGAKDER